jgi:hypothetical protein
MNGSALSFEKLPNVAAVGSYAAPHYLLSFAIVNTYYDVCAVHV